LTGKLPVLGLVKENRLLDGLICLYKAGAALMGRPGMKRPETAFRWIFGFACCAFWFWFSELL